MGPGMCSGCGECTTLKSKRRCFRLILKYVPNSTCSKPRILFSPNLTEYAERYGMSQYVLFKDSGKSGLTSIQFFLNTGAKDITEFNRWKHHETYQRSTLRSFATWELEESGCLTKADAKVSDFDFDIHPLWIESDG